MHRLTTLAPGLLLSLLCCGFLATPSVLGSEILLPSGNKTIWKYLDDGSDPGKSWHGEDFDDSGWKNGVAPLGYGETSLGTTIEFGPNERKKAATTFFRAELTVDKNALSGFENLGLGLKRDDGAIVFLNGTEVWRTNMPETGVGAKVWASRALSAPEESTRLTKVIPANTLKDGKNIVAVEIHQASPNSSDLFFDFEIIGYGKGETPVRDFYSEAQSALGRRNIEEALALLAQVPKENSHYSKAMSYLGHDLYAEYLRQPEKGIPFVQKAYEAAPGDLNVVRAYIRTHVLARKDFTIDTSTRKHAEKIPEAFTYLDKRYTWRREGQPIPGTKLLQDLDYLEEMLANCYSYLERRGADWESAIDALRISVKGGDSRQAFTWKLARFLHLFGDAHTRLGVSPIVMLPPGYAPFGAGVSKDRIFLFKPDRSDFLDPKHPYVRSLNGVATDKWMQAARANVAKVSEQWTSRAALKMLPAMGYLQQDFGMGKQDGKSELKVELESEDGTSSKILTLPLLRRPPSVKAWPNQPAGMLPENIGYLPITSMRSDQRHLRGLKKSMENFRATKGLIIDVRGNSGGTQDTLKTMLPYFLKPGAPMKIVNVAAYRMPIKLPEPNPSGFLGLYGRGLHPAASLVWSESERGQIEKFLEEFKPSWNLPVGKFSDWHVMAVRREDNSDAYYYDKPLIILSDAGSFSATDNFLGSFKGHPNVTIMGEPSGGGSGRMQRYQLPNSRLSLTLCQMASFSANGRLIEGNGVLPDVVILPTAKNQIEKGDTVLEAALKQLNGAEPSP